MNVWPQSSQLNCAPAEWALRSCSDSAEDERNEREQVEHACGRAPVWMRTCVYM